MALALLLLLSMNSEPPSLVAVQGGCEAVQVSSSRPAVQRVVAREIRRFPASFQLGEQAFFSDLNGDSGPELLVPLTCLGGDDCIWAALDMEDDDHLGLIAGHTLYVIAREDRWADLGTLTFVREGVVELRAYEWANGSYRQRSTRHLSGLALARFLSDAAFEPCRARPAY